MIEPLYLYIAVGFLLVVILLIVLLRKPRVADNTQSKFIAALNLMIDNEPEKALDVLHNVVRHDTEYIQAYILIGKILREKGAAQDATKVHRDLLVRPHLKEEQRRKILMNLAQDYMAIKQPQKALNICDQILEIHRNDEWAKLFKLQLLEGVQDWQGAYDLLKKKSKSEKTRLPLYKVEQGLQLAALGQEHDARLCYHESLKQDSACVAALVEFVKSYIRDERPKDALKMLEKFIKTSPQTGQLALDQLKKELFEINAFGELERYYAQILKRGLTASVALDLADIYMRKGEYRKALEQVNQLLKAEPDNQSALYCKIIVLEKLYDHENAAKIAVEALGFINTEKHFSCNVCKYTQHNYFWHCPTCNAWNSAQRG